MSGNIKVVEEPQLEYAKDKPRIVVSLVCLGAMFGNLGIYLETFFGRTIDGSFIYLLLTILGLSAVGVADHLINRTPFKRWGLR